MEATQATGLTHRLGSHTPASACITSGNCRAQKFENGRPTKGLSFTGRVAGFTKLVDQFNAAPNNICRESSDNRLALRCARTKETKIARSHTTHHPNGGVPKLPQKVGLKQYANQNDTDDILHLQQNPLVLGGYGTLLGTRIPKHYFMVKGYGETDQGEGSDPWETGSYDLALEDAGIQDLNIVKYSSVIPPESEALTLEEAKPFLRHGAVMESIMATMHGVKGDRITAGVGRMQIRKKKDKFHIGGYAAEYSGHGSEDTARNILRKDLTGIFERRFDSKDYEIFEEDYIIQEGEIDKSFGSVLASLCFVTYVFPVYTRTHKTTTGH